MPHWNAGRLRDLQIRPALDIAKQSKTTSVQINVVGVVCRYVSL